MNHEYDKHVPGIFYLVESKTNPRDCAKFKRQLNPNDTIESAFIGASDEDCQAWLLKEQDGVDFIETDILTIADARSAIDSTLLVKVYVREPGAFGFYDGIVDERQRFPEKGYTWYDFRIDYKAAWILLSDLHFGPSSLVDPVYYGRKDECVDQNGVFSVARADELAYHSGPPVIGKTGE